MAERRRDTGPADEALQRLTDRIGDWRDPSANADHALEEPLSEEPHHGSTRPKTSSQGSPTGIRRSRQADIETKRATAHLRRVSQGPEVEISTSAKQADDNRIITVTGLHEIPTPQAERVQPASDPTPTVPNFDGPWVGVYNGRVVSSVPAGDRDMIEAAAIFGIKHAKALYRETQAQQPKPALQAGAELTAIQSSVGLETNRPMALPTAKTEKALPAPAPAQKKPIKKGGKQAAPVKSGPPSGIKRSTDAVAMNTKPNRRSSRKVERQRRVRLGVMLAPLALTAILQPAAYINRDAVTETVVCDTPALVRLAMFHKFDLAPDACNGHQEGK